jgi:uncharacterized protein
MAHFDNAPCGLFQAHHAGGTGSLLAAGGVAMIQRATFLTLVGLSLALWPASCLAKDAEAPEQLISLERPGPREFVRDQAHLISEKDQQQVKQIADRLLTEKAVPIIVVTINSMADHARIKMRIEAFARLLFDQWAIGEAKLNGEDWNRGILLLVSKGDRKARIELGAGWRHDNDRQCEQIMEQTIIPHFQEGDFSGGLLAGVKALDQMARGLKLPHAAAGAHAGQGAAGQRSGTPSPLAILVMVAMAAVAVFTVVSLVRNGMHGWGWLLWAGVFALLGTILYSLMTNSGGGDSGGGFSGGSFGGGSSGGGGATGSWLLT